MSVNIILNNNLRVRLVELITAFEVVTILLRRVYTDIRGKDGCFCKGLSFLRHCQILRLIIRGLAEHLSKISRVISLLEELFILLWSCSVQSSLLH